MIPPATVQLILDTARVEDVVEEFVTLKRRGANLLGLCPFHNEKTPSFTVSPAKNLYKCFGCGKGGGAVSFLMEHEHLNYPEALRYLAKKYNITIEEVEKNDEQIQEEQHRQSLLLINEVANEYFQEQLLNTDEGRAIGLSYFKHRGLLENTIKTFDLGYAPKAGKAFSQYAVAKGYKEDLLKQLGLVSQSGYDFYRERVVFPFHSISGKIIGFGARQLTDNKKSPKYLNSPESDIYNKRKTLYGIFQAKSEIRRKDQCILVEGYTDVLSLYQNGIKNVVASSGTSLTNEQARLIKRFTNSVTVLYDGDAAGQNAAIRGLDIFLEADVNAKVVMLPEGHDPDSYVRKVGASAFEDFLQNQAQDFILMRANAIQAQTQGDPVNKSIRIRELVDSIAKMREQMKRALYIKECSAILDVDENSLIKETNRAIHQHISKKKKEQQRDKSYQQPSEAEYVNNQIETDHSQPSQIIVKREHHQEKDIIRVLLQHGTKMYDEDSETNIATFVLANLDGLMESIEDELYKKIIMLYQQKVAEDEVPDEQFFIQHEETAIRELAVTLLADPNTYANWEERGIELQTQKPVEENHVKDSYQAVLRFKLLKTKERIKEIEAAFASYDTDKHEVLLTAYQTLLSERSAIAAELNTVVL